MVHLHSTDVCILRVAPRNVQGQPGRSWAGFNSSNRAVILVPCQGPCFRSENLVHVGNLKFSCLPIRSPRHLPAPYPMSHLPRTTSCLLVLSPSQPHAPCFASSFVGKSTWRVLASVDCQLMTWAAPMIESPGPIPLRALVFE